MEETKHWDLCITDDGKKLDLTIGTPIETAKTYRLSRHRVETLRDELDALLEDMDEG